jgi:EAL domain-containing protein (putative c-di-GMP-specific phosphodiesterase class I)/CheY-like chemotaxis protein
MPQSTHPANESTVDRPSPAPRADATARRKCFIVEDEPGVRDMLRSVLGGGDIELAGFASAQELLDAWGPQHPDIIFLDIALDHSDAVDVIRTLAACRFSGAVQLMSGLDRELHEQVKRVGEQHGLVMLPPLAKPFRAGQIQAVVQNYFAQRRRDGDTATRAESDGDFRLALGASLDEILANGWLQFHYQPKLDLRHRCVVGAEVLARCRHPELGVIPPGAFLPDADENAVRQLSTLALTAALRDWKKFAVAGFALKLAVNVTVNDLLNLPIHALVREMRPADLRWPGLILEVTEDQAVRDIALAQEVATQLRIYDITLALDDFGSGYSHLARLKELPFSEVKLDRAMVANCGEEGHNASLCQTAIDLAHHFGATVVAEGIEKRSELQALTTMGCDIGQGFLFAPPMPQDKLIALLQELAHKVAPA